MSFFASLLALGLAASSSSLVEASPAALLGRPRPGPGSGPGGGRTAGSPAYPLYEYALPIPVVAKPIFEETINGRPVQYYSTTIAPFQKQVYRNLGPANFVGFNGTVPGPTYMIPRGTETVIRYLNNATQTSAVHLHGSYTHSVWDGWAFDDVAVGYYKDYYYPNSESARPMWYHDHANGITADNAYNGQTGVYIITDSAEDSLGLPRGDYDVPLTLSDKIYQSNGDIAPLNGNRMNFFGDVLEVNGQPWPYMNVEPRKYRFRFFNMALSRAFDLSLVDHNSNTVQLSVIASDSGLFSAPVKSNDVTISMGERYEVVVDFSGFKGQNMTLMNGKIPQIQDFANTNQIMRFVVGQTVSDSSNNQLPSSLNPNIPWPASRSTVDHTYNFQLGGASTWTVNGVDFNSPEARVLARPPQGTVEHWKFRHTGGPSVHPVHLHLINMQVIARSGSRGLLPYEAAGLKDVVMLAPGEEVDVLAQYGPWNGMYMFHCHNLVHEDSHMMAAFNTTKIQDLGYDFNSTSSFEDPMDTRFTAKKYTPAAYELPAIHKAVSSLAALNAYAPASALIAAEEKYYATAGYHGDAAPATSTSARIAAATTAAAATATASATTTRGPLLALPTTLPKIFGA